jgi:hypothetical protein
MSREAERKREKKEYLEQLLECIPLLRELLESLVDERREEEMWNEEYSMHQEQYEMESYDAVFETRFIDEWR